MKTYSKTTEETLIAFHIGRGGRFNNQGHKSYLDQDKAIDSYTDHLFTNYENQYKIDRKIGDRENLQKLFQSAIDGNNQAFERIEKITGIEFGKQIYTDGNGNPVGLDVENDGTGIIDEDGEYDTTIVIRLEDCSEDELLLIHNSNNYRSSDVVDFVKAAFIAGEKYVCK